VQNALLCVRLNYNVQERLIYSGNRKYATILKFGLSIAIVTSNATKTTVKLEETKGWYKWYSFLRYHRYSGNMCNTMY